MEELKQELQKVKEAYQNAELINPVITGDWTKLDEWVKLDSLALSISTEFLKKVVVFNLNVFSINMITLYKITDDVVLRKHFFLNVEI